MFLGQKLLNKGKHLSATGRSEEKRWAVIFYGEVKKEEKIIAGT